MDLVYKILTAAQWLEFEDEGQFAGAPVDHADGFIHLSATDQVIGTAEKHFAGQQDLVLVGVNVEKLGNALKWEVSRDNTKFPHYYGLLRMEHVVTTQSLAEFIEGS